MTLWCRNEHFKMFPTKLLCFSLLFWCKWCFMFEATKILTWVFVLSQSEPYKLATGFSNSWRDKRLKHKFWVLRLNHCLPSYKSQTHTNTNWEFKNAFCIKIEWLFTGFAQSHEEIINWNTNSGTCIFTLVPNKVSDSTL